MDNLFYRRKKTLLNPSAILKKLLRNKRLVLLLLAGLPLAGYLVFGNRGILQRVRMQQEKTELEKAIRQTEAENRSLKQQSTALDGDKKAIEKVARERYRMAREGETVYKVNRKQ